MSLHYSGLRNDKVNLFDQNPAENFGLQIHGAKFMVANSWLTVKV